MKTHYKGYCPNCKWLALKGQIVWPQDFYRPTGPCLECIRMSREQKCVKPENYILWEGHYYVKQ